MVEDGGNAVSEKAKKEKPNPFVPPTAEKPARDWSNFDPSAVSMVGPRRPMNDLPAGVDPFAAAPRAALSWEEVDCPYPAGGPTEENPWPPPPRPRSVPIDLPLLGSSPPGARLRSWPGMPERGR